MRSLTRVLSVVIGSVLPASVTQTALATAGVPQEPSVIVTVPEGLAMVKVGPDAPEAGVLMLVASWT